MSYPSPDLLKADLSEWQTVSKWLVKAKEKEMELRLRLSKHFFGDIIPEGTNKAEFENLKIKAVGKMNRTVLEELRASTMEEAKLNAEQAQGLLKVNYDLSLTAYKGLSTEQQKIVDKMIVLKPASPTLEVELIEK